MRPLVATTLVVALSSAIVAQSPDETLQRFYAEHRWFELRDAIAGKPVLSLYAGVVASAFNRTTEALRYLTRAIREASTPERANDAREALANLYMRLGRSADMLKVLDDALAITPSRRDFRNARQAFEFFRHQPSQWARTGRGRPFRCSVTARGVFLPGLVNGKPVEWLLDTAFSHSALSESEARMLGISAFGNPATGEDFAGGTATARMAMADRMVIGDSELRHVPVVVFPDSQPPWNEQPPGKRGAIGLPVVAALQAIRWTRDGVCQLGANARRTSTAEQNLALDGLTPVTRVQVLAKPLEFVLDSGNQVGTQLWERFAREFPQVTNAGQRSTKVVHQIGGAAERELVMLPEIRLRVGGLDAVLQPANVFSKPVGTDHHHGNLGVDVLIQAREVIGDFQTMSLTLRQK